MKKSLFFALFCFIVCSVQAQIYPADCVNAIPICNKEPRRDQINQSPGLYDDELDGFCVFPDNNFQPIEGPSYWFMWKVATAGDLYFTITPEDLDTIVNDIDFIVFKAPDVDGCDQKEAIRCMWSGESIGSTPQENASCIGPTGLRPGETDFNEAPGCRDSSNNFLAPLQCEPGDVYILFISNFTEKGSYFDIEFGGSATLSCDFISSLSSSIQTKGLNIYPNPLVAGPIHIELPSAEQGEAELSIFTMTGQLLARDQVELIDGRLRLDMQTSDWPELVLISLQTQDTQYNGKLLLVK